MQPSDRNYILSSWLRSFAGKSEDGRGFRESGSLTDFFTDYAPVVRSLIDRSAIVVACLKEKPDAIAGWMAIEEDALHYVLVKPRWRRCGVARWMLADYASVPVVFTHETSDSRRCPVPEAWRLRRWRVWPKEREQ
ncbi:hypothetical protein AKJ09_03680 [Labilithrix luteola]|uniref:N-acetyltransferase domain-containing protein n=1 Tax=Labilithrix luteola TaxID=1391654 RepID=A0A0K1PUG9_9BACT|nr:hypothetical protein [Labilithrix luteola]AKU97016.1 hypothetical protein AKJ09_03680 [Labilithrix luteola]